MLSAVLTRFCDASRIQQKPAVAEFSLRNMRMAEADDIRASFCGFQEDRCIVIAHPVHMSVGHKNAMAADIQKQFVGIAGIIAVSSDCMDLIGCIRSQDGINVSFHIPTVDQHVKRLFLLHRFP